MVRSASSPPKRTRGQETKWVGGGIGFQLRGDGRGLSDEEVGGLMGCRPAQTVNIAVAGFGRLAAAFVPTGRYHLEPGWRSAGVDASSAWKPSADGRFGNSRDVIGHWREQRWYGEPDKEMGS